MSLFLKALLCQIDGCLICHLSVFTMTSSLFHLQPVKISQANMKKSDGIIHATSLYIINPPTCLPANTNNICSTGCEGEVFLRHLLCLPMF